MVDGDRRRMELAYSLLFTPPRHPRPPLRRGDRARRRPAHARPRGRPAADAVVGSPRSRLHHRGRANPPATTARGRSIRLRGPERRRTSARTPARSSTGWSAQSARARSGRPSAGASTGCSARAARPRSRTSRPGMGQAPSPCTTSAAATVNVTVRLPADAARGRWKHIFGCRRRRGAGGTPRPAQPGAAALRLPLVRPAGRRLTMAPARIGFHASHEQFRPDRLLRLVQAAEAAGFDAAMCSDHWAPWSDEQGESGFAWSWLGAALQADLAPLRRGECAWPALSPRHHRAGGRHAGRDVSGPLLDRHRFRPAAERAHHRRTLAGQG